VLGAGKQFTLVSILTQSLLKTKILKKKQIFIQIRVVVFYVINSRILKANLSWSPTWTKFCRLIASLLFVLPQLNLTKLKLKVPEVSAFSEKKKDTTQSKFFASLEFDFFRSAQVCF